MIEEHIHQYCVQPTAACLASRPYFVILYRKNKQCFVDSHQFSKENILYKNSDYSYKLHFMSFGFSFLTKTILFKSN